MVGLVGVGEGRAERVGNGGDGAEAILSAREAILTILLSVFKGLGGKSTGSLDGTLLGSVTESMEERLALLPCDPLIAYDAALERLLERSGMSGVLGPDKTDNAELRETIDGRMT
jgi:hypothetical protein